MKAVTYDPDNDKFQVKELPIPKLADSDVLVRVDACGLNPVDAKIARWKTMAPEMDACWTPGLDVSGHIVEVGPNVTGWSVGDRVLYHGNMFRPHGGFAEYAIQDSATLTSHPNVSASLAAATPCAGWTAWRALHDKMRAGHVDSILIAGGSGGVGGFAIQIARYLGLKTVIATCSTKNKDYVTQLGATHVIDYESEDVIQRALEITNQSGVSLGLDTVGFGNDILVAGALAFEGQMVEIVGTVRPASYADAFAKGLTFHQLSLGAGHRFGAAAAKTLVAAGKAFSGLVEGGHVKIPVSEIIPMDEVAAALREMLNQRTVGKIVMEI